MDRRLPLVGALLATTFACGVSLVGKDDGSDAGDGGPSGPADGSVVPGEDASSSSSGGVMGCAALAVFPSSAFDFGAVRVGSSATGRLVLRNLSGAPITVSALDLGVPFTFASATTIVVQPTVPANLDIGFSPTTDLAAVARVRLEWPGCSTGINVTGVGSTADLIVNPATLNLGSAQCGAVVPSGQVTISSTISTTYTAQIAAPFTTATEPSVVTNNVPAKHTVGMGAFGPNDPPTRYEGMLQLTFAVGGTKTVKVLAESVGGVVNVNNVTLDPTGIAIFRNTGNESVSVKLLEVGLSFSPSMFDLPSGATQNVTITRTNMSLTTFQVKVNVSAGKNCGGTPFFLVSANK